MTTAVSLVQPLLLGCETGFPDGRSQFRPTRLSREMLHPLYCRRLRYAPVLDRNVIRMHLPRVQHMTVFLRCSGDLRGDSKAAFVEVAPVLDRDATGERA